MTNSVATYLLLLSILGLLVLFWYAFAKKKAKRLWKIMLAAGILTGIISVWYYFPQNKQAETLSNDTSHYRIEMNIILRNVNVDGMQYQSITDEFQINSDDYDALVLLLNKEKWTRTILQRENIYHAKKPLSNHACLLTTLGLSAKQSYLDYMYIYEDNPKIYFKLTEGNQIYYTIKNYIRI